MKLPLLVLMTTYIRSLKRLRSWSMDNSSSSTVDCIPIRIARLHRNHLHSLLHVHENASHYLGYIGYWGMGFKGGKQRHSVWEIGTACASEQVSYQCQVPKNGDKWLTVMPIGIPKSRQASRLIQYLWNFFSLPPSTLNSFLLPASFSHITLPFLPQAHLVLLELSWSTCPLI